MGNKQSEAFRRWYAKHGKEYNRKRRAKYKKDEAYRQGCIARVRQYRGNTQDESDKSDE